MSDAHAQPELNRPATRYRPLVVVAAAFCAGIVLDRGAGLSFGLWWWAASAALGLWWHYWRRDQIAAAGTILLAGVALAGAGRHHLRWNLFDRHELALVARPAPEPVCLEAIALEEPRHIPATAFTPLRAFAIGPRSRLAIQPIRLRNGRSWQTAWGRAILTVDGDLAGVQAGDVLEIFGRLSLLRAADNPGQYDASLDGRAEGRLAQVFTDIPQCVTVKGGRKSRFAGWTDKLRGAGQQLLAGHLQHQRTGLAAALLLGLREQLDPERNEQFLETGTVHILSISGLHVGMVAAVLFGLLRLGWFPRRAALCGVALLTIAYALLTDAGAPVVRAAVIVVATCLAMALLRRNSIFNALAAAAILVLCLSPGDLFRAGPQLSFLSVAAIFLVGPRLSRLGVIHDPLARLIAGSRSWPVRLLRALGVRLLQALALSAIVWLVTAPLVLARFHIVAPIGLVLNLCLWLPVATALGCGLALLSIGWIATPIADALGAGCDASLSAMERIVDWGNQLPAAHFWLPGPSDWWLAGFYGGLAVVSLTRWRPPRRWMAALLAGWIAGGFLFGTGAAESPQVVRGQMVGPPRIAIAPATLGSLDCAFLSVGHGLAVVLELPDGQVLLYDVGQLGSPAGVARTVAGYLWSRGITHIDAVMLSHADLDHFNGLPELVERFSVGRVLVSPFMFEQQGASLLALSKALEQQQIPVTAVSAGDRLRCGHGCRIEVLHPTRAGVLGSDNANSLVLAIEFAGRRILLTGDLETPGLEAVLAEEAYDCDVLLAPHHGSLRSNPSGMAEWCRPQWVVVSGGYEVDPQLPQAYRATGARVLDTASAGAILVHVDPRQLRVSTFH